MRLPGLSFLAECGDRTTRRIAVPSVARDTADYYCAEVWAWAAQVVRDSNDLISGAGSNSESGAVVVIRHYTESHGSRAWVARIMMAMAIVL